MVENVAQLGCREGRREWDGYGVGSQAGEESDFTIASAASPLAGCCEYRLYIGQRTYIVIPVLNQERYPFAHDTVLVLARGLQKPLLRRRDILQYGAVGEGASGEGVHDGGAVWVVLLDRFEEGGALERKHGGGEEGGGGGEGT